VLSTSPFTYTRLPILVVVGMAAYLAFAAGLDTENLLLLAVTAAVACIAIRAASGTFADKVSDGGDHLLVRIGREEERIPLIHVESVHESHNLKPTRIQLTLKYETRFGREIEFIPAGLFKMSWGKSAVFQELDERVRAAQEGRPI
jgi:hypothetical protein